MSWAAPWCEERPGEGLEGARGDDVATVCSQVATTCFGARGGEEDPYTPSGWAGLRVLMGQVGQKVSEVSSLSFLYLFFCFLFLSLFCS